MDPMIRGDYPEVMKQYLGARLPQFTEAERQLLKGSLDYVGINHYTTYYVAQAPESGKGPSTMFMDLAADISISGTWEDCPNSTDSFQKLNRYI